MDTQALLRLSCRPGECAPRLDALSFDGTPFCFALTGPLSALMHLLIMVTRVLSFLSETQLINSFNNPVSQEVNQGQTAALR